MTGQSPEAVARIVYEAYETREVEPDDEAHVEHETGMILGLVAIARGKGRILRLIERGDQVTGAAAFDPTFPGAHLHLAKIHFRRREPIEARSHLRGEILLRPQDTQVLMELSNLLMDSGESRPAVACLKRLVQLDHHTGGQNLHLGGHDEQTGVAGTVGHALQIVAKVLRGAIDHRRRVRRQHAGLHRSAGGRQRGQRAAGQAVRRQAARLDHRRR